MAVEMPAESEIVAQLLSLLNKTIEITRKGNSAADTKRAI